MSIGLDTIEWLSLSLYGKTLVFPVILYGCQSWTIKKAEPQRTDAFELWCWRRLLRVLWTARRSNRSILKEISPEYSLEALMLKLQYFGHLMRRTDSLEKTLMLGKIKSRRRRGWQRMRWLDGITADLKDMSWSSSGSWWWTGRPGMLQSMRLQRVRCNWTELIQHWAQHLTLCVPRLTGIRITNLWKWICQFPPHPLCNDGGQVSSVFSVDRKRRSYKSSHFFDQKLSLKYKEQCLASGVDWKPRRSLSLMLPLK